MRTSRLLRLSAVVAALLVACGDDTAPGGEGGSPGAGSPTGSTTSSAATGGGDGGTTGEGGDGHGAGAGEGGTAGSGGAGGGGGLGPDVEVDLPGTIEGVEPEAHAHHPPMMDAEGTLYRVTESPQAEENRPMMMRSTDWGATWAEVDEMGRPEAHDLEGCWQLQVDDAIHLSVASSSSVWFATFHTSAAATGADTWVAEEVVEEDLGNEGGVVQFSSMTRTSDGRFWLFHSDTMIDGRQQIGFRQRSEGGDWSGKRSLGDEDGSWTGPVAVLGADDVTHVFYKDHLEDQLLWRTLSADGDLSDAVRVDTAGTSGERLPHTNAVRLDDDGRDVVVIAFTDDDGTLRSVTIEDGVVGPDEAVSLAPALENPDVAKNDGAVAHLAVDGTTVHALWSDLESGDVLHASRADGGAWSEPAIAWDSGDDVAWWVYGNVYVRHGRTRLGFTYDVGEHADDVGAIAYDEITLDP